MAHEITLPRLGWSMEQGTFLGWRKRDGDFVRAGEPLFELEGEKATQEIEALDSGILRIPPDSPPVGTVVPVGTVLGYLVAEGEPAAAPSVRRLARELGVELAAVDGTGPAGRITAHDVRALGKDKTPLPNAAVAAGAVVDGTDAGTVFETDSGTNEATSVTSSPRARRIAAELGVDWRSLRGSGRSGRVRECDVRQAASSSGAGRPAAAAGSSKGRTRIAISSRRRTIAQRMLASSQRTAPVTLTARIDATNLVNLRSQFKSVGQAVAIPSYTDIFVKLAGAALQKHPLLAARWEEDDLVLPETIHIGIGVDTDDGLVVPVVRDVPALSLTQLARRSHKLIERARAGRLSAAEMQGGVFTISNLGAFGVDAFTPIINSPETAVLGVGRILREPVVYNGQIVPRDQVTLSLTFDHRVVNGAPAARFLQTLRDAVENPSAWLLNAESSS